MSITTHTKRYEHLDGMILLILTLSCQMKTCQKNMLKHILIFRQLYLGPLVGVQVKKLKKLNIENGKRKA